MDHKRLAGTVIGVGLVRLAAGVALGGAPRTFLRWERAIPDGSAMVLLMRTVGIRDLALGWGTTKALRSGTPEEVARWVAAGLVSDALDVAAGLAATRSTGARGVVSALIAAPMVLADVWALAALHEQRRTAPR